MLTIVNVDGDSRSIDSVILSAFLGLNVLIRWKRFRSANLFNISTVLTPSTSSYRPNVVT